MACLVIPQAKLQQRLGHRKAVWGAEGAETRWRASYRVDFSAAVDACVVNRVVNGLIAGLGWFRVGGSCKMETTQ